MVGVVNQQRKLVSCVIVGEPTLLCAVLHTVLLLCCNGACYNVLSSQSMLCPYDNRTPIHICVDVFRRI